MLAVREFAPFNVHEEPELRSGFEYLTQRLFRYLCELSEVVGHFPEVQFNGGPTAFVNCEQCDPLDIEKIKRAANLTSLFCSVEITILQFDRSEKAQNTTRFAKRPIEVRLPSGLLDRIESEDPREGLRYFNPSNPEPETVKPLEDLCVRHRPPSPRDLLCYESGAIQFNGSFEHCVLPWFQRFLEDLCSVAENQGGVILELNKVQGLKRVIMQAPVHQVSSERLSIAQISLRAHVAESNLGARVHFTNAHALIAIPSPSLTPLRLLLNDLCQYGIPIEVCEIHNSGPLGTLTQSVPQIPWDSSLLPWQQNILGQIADREGKVQGSKDRVIRILELDNEPRLYEGTYQEKATVKNVRRHLPDLVGIGQGSHEDLIGVEELPNGNGWRVQMAFISSAHYIPYESILANRMFQRHEAFYAEDGSVILPLLPHELHSKIGGFSTREDRVALVCTIEELRKDGTYSVPIVSYENVRMFREIAQGTFIRRRDSGKLDPHLALVSDVEAHCATLFDRAFPRHTAPRVFSNPIHNVNWLIHLALEQFFVRNNVHVFVNMGSALPIRRSTEPSMRRTPYASPFLSGSFRKAISYANHLVIRDYLESGSLRSALNLPEVERRLNSGLNGFTKYSQYLQTALMLESFRNGVYKRIRGEWIVTCPDGVSASVVNSPHSVKEGQSCQIKITEVNLLTRSFKASHVRAL